MKSELCNRPWCSSSQHLKPVFIRCSFNVSFKQNKRRRPPHTGGEAHEYILTCSPDFRHWQRPWPSLHIFYWGWSLEPWNVLYLYVLCRLYTDIRTVLLINKTEEKRLNRTRDLSPRKWSLVTVTYEMLLLSFCSSMLGSVSPSAAFRSPSPTREASARWCRSSCVIWTGDLPPLSTIWEDRQTSSWTEITPAALHPSQ